MSILLWGKIDPTYGNSVTQNTYGRHGLNIMLSIETRFKFSSFYFFHFSGVQVSPSRATRYGGDTVRLNCSDPSSEDSLNWIHTPPDSSKRTYIYISGMGVFIDYELSGRHSVEVDDSSGSCDLLIKRVSVEDAGTYICRRGDGEHQEIELVIIGLSVLLCLYYFHFISFSR